MYGHHGARRTRWSGEVAGWRGSTEVMEDALGKVMIPRKALDAIKLEMNGVSC